MLITSEAVYRLPTLLSVSLVGVHAKHVAGLVLGANVSVLILGRCSSSRNLSDDFLLDGHTVLDVVEPFSYHF